ncbi:hypothetical protein [Azohydromonas lata]|uniref:hypothetical protein n=1 Tax=Azohydromonas lata TaxID=45677 RepID=UPI00083510D5|nr:hypothetical protein [Azohydromonas lata]
MDDEDKEDLAAGIDSLRASIAGLTVAIGALIQTHPRHAQMQLAMTALLEQQLGSGALSAVLNERQREQVRDLVEWLGSIRAQKS